MEYLFDKLTESDIELRVAQDKDSFVDLLAYKDARVDQNALDEKFGSMGWQRDHKEIKGVMYCGVALKSESGEWIWKWDAGKESNTEAEKGEASDSFKRACFNWGIGRELYTMPQIRLWKKDYAYDKFLRYRIVPGTLAISDDRKVTSVAVEALKFDKSIGEVFRWTLGKLAKPKATMQKAAPAAEEEGDLGIFAAMDELERVKSRAALEAADRSWRSVYGKEGSMPNTLWRKKRAELELIYLDPSK